MLLSLFLISALLAGCIGQTPTAKPEEVKGVTLKIITRHSSTIWQVTKKLFLGSEIAKKYNIAELRFLGPQPTLWLDTIKRVGDIDVAWGGGPTLFDELMEEGLLAPIKSQDALNEVSQIPDEIGGGALKRYDGQGNLMWVAAAISSFGFIVNYDVLNQYGLPEPKLWEDLANPKLAKVLPKPVVAYARPTTSTSHTRIYQIILQKFGWVEGWSLLARIAANGRPYGGSVEALTAVQTGETPISIAIDFYGYSSQVEFPNTKYILPYNESIVNGDPIALLKTSKHPEAAQAFIAFIISVEGQKIWLDKRINRMPVREDVFKTKQGKERKDLQENYRKTIENIGIPFDDSRAIKTEFALRYYFDAVYADLHDELVEVWSKLVNSYEEGKLSREGFEKMAFKLGEPLEWSQNGVKYKFTEDYAASINEKLKDSSFASEMSKLWRDVAREKYRGLLKEIP